VGIFHAGRNSGGAMAAAHRSHVAGGEAGHAPAGGDPQLRGAIACAHRGRWTRALRLHRKEFAVRVARYSDSHSRHVIGDVEGTLALIRLERAIAGSFRLLGAGMDVEASTVGSGGAGVLLELLLDGIRRVSGRGRRRRSRRAVASGQARDDEGYEKYGSFHGRMIVNRAGPCFTRRRGSDRVLSCERDHYVRRWNRDNFLGADFPPRSWV
jgi:hypothetical protein